MLVGVLQIKAGVAVAVLLMTALAGLGTTAAGSATDPTYDPVTDGYPQATCFWFGPMGEMDPRTNLAYPDEGALYWGARFRLPEGSVLRFRADYPRARFMSLNAYLDQGATDSREDRDITPDKGSTNPYTNGADRFAKKRAYRITIAGPGKQLPHSAPNAS